MSTLQDAALTHLHILRVDPAKVHDDYFVRLAFTYGVEVPEIVHASGLSIERVQSILGGS